MSPSQASTCSSFLFLRSSHFLFRLQQLFQDANALIATFQFLEQLLQTRHQGFRLDGVQLRFADRLTVDQTLQFGKLSVSLQQIALKAFDFGLKQVYGFGIDALQQQLARSTFVVCPARRKDLRGRPARYRQFSLRRLDSPSRRSNSSDSSRDRRRHAFTVDLGLQRRTFFPRVNRRQLHREIRRLASARRHVPHRPRYPVPRESRIDQYGFSFHLATAVSSSIRTPLTSSSQIGAPILHE